MLVIKWGYKLWALQQGPSKFLKQRSQMKHNACVRIQVPLNFSGQARWCIMANPKVLTPISYEGEMRHTVPLFCYKSFFVDVWQLFIRSNLFKPPLRVLTFSTLTHLQFTNRTADLVWEEGSWVHAHCHSLFIVLGGQKRTAKWWMSSELHAVRTALTLLISWNTIQSFAA